MVTTNPIYRFFYILSSYSILCAFMYILPAVVIMVISFDLSVYKPIVTCPAYAGLYGIFCLVMTGVYIAQQIDDDKM